MLEAHCKCVVERGWSLTSAAWGEQLGNSPNLPLCFELLWRIIMIQNSSMGPLGVVESLQMCDFVCVVRVG